MPIPSLPPSPIPDPPYLSLSSPPTFFPPLPPLCPDALPQELPYGTMGDEEMRNLGIKCLQDDGVIFLWVTGVCVGGVGGGAREGGAFATDTPGTTFCASLPFSRSSSELTCCFPCRARNGALTLTHLSSPALSACRARNGARPRVP